MLKGEFWGLESFIRPYFYFFFFFITLLSNISTWYKYLLGLLKLLNMEL